MIATLAGLALAGSASASFVEFYTVKTQVTHVPTSTLLDVYKIYARFNGPTDTILNAFNLNGLAGAPMNGFYHQDNASSASVLSTAFGTWNPALTGNATLNRPFDSYLTIGGLPTATNGTSADPSWGNPLSWNRADIPNNVNAGWFAPGGSIAGRVGQVGNTADSVILGQFVVAAGTNFGQGYTITIGYNNGIAGAPVQFASGTFLVMPCPTWYRDIDGDGFGSAADGVQTTCTQPTGYVLVNGDNCPSIANANQADVNLNNVGDACELARGDLNLDGIVNASDVPLLFNAWGSLNPTIGDLNGDGVVNSADFSILLSNWGTTV
jgi:hypothetical protein